MTVTLSAYGGEEMRAELLGETLRDRLAHLGTYGRIILLCFLKKEGDGVD